MKSGSPSLECCTGRPGRVSLACMTFTVDFLAKEVPLSSTTTLDRYWYSPCFHACHDHTQLISAPHLCNREI